MKKWAIAAVIAFGIAILAFSARWWLGPLLGFNDLHKAAVDTICAEVAALLALLSIPILAIAIIQLRREAAKAKAQETRKPSDAGTGAQVSTSDAATATIADRGGRVAIASTGGQVISSESGGRVTEIDGKSLYIEHVDKLVIAPDRTEPRAVDASASRGEATTAKLPIWNVPHSRNPHFTGRKQLLKNLRNQLLSGRAAALVAIHGLGGVGKTQTATEYAYEHRPDYEIVWWVRGDQPTTLASDYAGLAAELGLPQANQPDLRLAAQAVKRELEHRSDWLLIFDNAEKPDDLRDFIPQSGGHTIITSRNQHWSGIGSEISVQKLARPESIAFLFDRTKRDERDDADKLAEELGDLPLALEQAAAYIVEISCSIAHYLDLFKKHRRKLMAWSAASGYPDTVATTWEISFQRLASESPAAMLLNLCAFFAPDRIPLDMISAGRQFLAEPLASVVADPVELGKAKKALRQYSLADAGDGEISVHRLVHAVCRDR